MGVPTRPPTPQEGGQDAHPTGGGDDLFLGNPLIIATAKDIN